MGLLTPYTSDIGATSVARPGRVGAGGVVTILGVRRLKCRLGDVVAFSPDLRVPPMFAFVPRQCCQHSLLVAPCLLLDFSVLELVDVPPQSPPRLGRPRGS